MQLSIDIMGNRIPMYRTYILYEICENSDCFNNKLMILFSRPHATAFGTKTIIIMNEFSTTTVDFNKIISQ